MDDDMSHLVFHPDHLLDHLGLEEVAPTVRCWVEPDTLYVHLLTMGLDDHLPKSGTYPEISAMVAWVEMVDTPGTILELVGRLVPKGVTVTVAPHEDGEGLLRASWARWDNETAEETLVAMMQAMTRDRD